MQEIQLYSKLNDPLAAITQMGEFFAKSGMFGCEKIEQGKVLAMVCLSENKSPVQIMRTYHMMDGKLSKKALAVLAEFRGLGGKHKWIASGDDGIAAIGEFMFEGNTIKVSFSMEDAKKQKLVKPNGNWEKTPGNMLRARVITNAIAMLAPEIFAGEDDGESGQAPAAPLLNEKPAKVTKVEPAPAQTTVVTTDAPAQTGTATQAPIEVTAEIVKETPTETAEKPFTAADAAAKDGKLTAKTMAAIQSAIGEQHCNALVEWLKGRGWIKAELHELTVERAQRILSKPSEVIGMLTKGAK